MKHFLSLLAGVAMSSSLFATTFLVQPGGAGAAWRAAADGETLVDLTGTTLNAWYSGATLVAGDNVWILKGEYLLDGTITPKGGESIYGGFVGTETSASARVVGAKPWEMTNETVLKGNSTFQIMTSSLLSTDPTLIDGVTITKGFGKPATGATFNSFAGIKVGPKTTLQNSKITDNTMDVTLAPTGASGCGVLLTSNTSVLKNSHVYANSNWCAVGMSGGAQIIGCTVENNNTLLATAGVAMTNGGAGGPGSLIEDCIFKNNTGISTGALNFYTNATNTTAHEVKNCTFEGNIVTATTGNPVAGISIAEALGQKNTYKITGCTFKNNVSSPVASANGGALLQKNASLIIDRCVFDGNSRGCVVLGGGAGTKATISNSVFKNNVAVNATGVDQNSAAINSKNPLVLNNCLFYGNKGANVMTIDAPVDTVTIVNNCTFAANTKNDGITAVGVLVNVNPTLTTSFKNCIAYNATSKPFGTRAVSVSYCGFESTADLSVYNTVGGGNIQTIDATSFKDAAGLDFSLSETSPAIDAGTVIAACSPDLAGVDRTNGGLLYDMGAYEYAYKLYTTVPKATDNSEIKVSRISANSLAVFAPIGSNVIIYNALGSVVLKAKNVPGSTILSSANNGIYLVEVTNGSARTVKKVVL